MKIYMLIHFHRSESTGNLNQPIPIFAPAVCKIRPDNPVTRSVTARDVARWQSKPEELIGKSFTTTEEIMRRTFLVQDYYIKRHGGARYDVVFEDTGFEIVSILDPD